MPTSAAVSYVKPAGLIPAHAPEQAVLISVRLKASTTYPQGALLGEVSASPGRFGPYDHSASDGTQTIRAILKYAAKTDSNGKIVFGDTNPGEDGVLHETAEVYVFGLFHSEDIPTSGSGAMDATNAIADGLGKKIYGDLTTGCFLLR